MVLLSLPLVATLLMGLPLMGGSPSPIPDNHIDHANTISHSYANSHSHSYANSHSHSHSHSMGNSHGHAHSNIHSQSSRHYDNTTGDSLPLLPFSLPTVAFNSSYNKHIPRQLWIAVKDKADELPGHLQAFFARNPEWHVNVCDNACKDAFMREVFAGTSVLWAYELINPLVGAARADIWRYSVLYTYGGVYLDDDSDIKVPLDQIIRPDDKLIMSEEGASSLGHCYVPSYHLSDLFVRDHYFQQCGASLDKQLLHLDGTDSSGVPIFFHGHTLINWAMFVAPRHPVLGRSLQNIVELVRSQFLHQSLLVITPWDKRVRNWKQVMCTTGFTLTYTVREMELEYALPDTDRAASSGCVKNKDSLFILKKEDMPRISLNNFKEYHGNVKAIWTGGDQSHYMKAMNRKNGPKLLHSYAPFSLSEYMNHLNGRAVSDEAGKSLLLVHNGSVVNFGSYQRFLNMNFTSDLVIFVPVQLLSKVPVLEHFPFPEIPVD